MQRSELASSWLGLLPSALGNLRSEITRTGKKQRLRQDLKACQGRMRVGSEPAPCIGYQSPAPVDAVYILEE